MIDIDVLIELLKTDLKVNPKIKESNKTYFKQKNNTIYYEIKDIDLDTIFNLAHEFRHAYQAKYNESIFNNYKTRKELSLKEYNLQEAELDAHAYAWHFVNKFITPDLKPLFNGFDDDIKQEIEKRKKALDN